MIMNARDPIPKPIVVHDRSSEEGLVREFAVQNPTYYIEVFARIRRASNSVWPFNVTAALLGPVWAAARGTMVLFWIAFFLEMLAVVQIGVGVAGNLGTAEQARAERLSKQADARAEQAKAAEAAGADNAAGLKSSAGALQKAAAAALSQAQVAKEKAPLLIGLGL